MSLYQGPPVIVTGNAHPELANRVVEMLRVKLGEVTVGRFPDNEIKVKFGENIRGRDVFIVQPTHSFGPIGSESIIELLIMLDAARRASAGRVTAVTPYFGYARQDRKDEPRVAISAKLMVNWIVVSGADRFLAIDLHSGQIQGFTDQPFDHIYARPALIDHLRARGIVDPTYAATDLGASKYVRSWAKRHGTRKPVLMDKRRIDDWNVEITQIYGDVADQDIILVDDEIETGVTMVAAAQAVLERGARSVRAVATHGKFIDGTVDRLLSVPFTEIVVTDTLPHPVLPLKFTEISVANLLAGVIRDIHNEESVSRHFD